jgi:hypothetical protein
MICFALHGGITGRNRLKFKKRFTFLRSNSPGCGVFDLLLSGHGQKFGGANLLCVFGSQESRGPFTTVAVPTRNRRI